MEKFTKQPYEEFTISADFSNNFADDETIVAETVSAMDEAENDVTDIVTDQGTVSNDAAGSVLVIVRAGTELESPYKITFRCVTSKGHKWELDVSMGVYEI